MEYIEKALICTAYNHVLMIDDYAERDSERIYVDYATWGGLKDTIERLLHRAMIEDEADEVDTDD